MKKTLFLLSAILVLTTSIFSQTPESFKYQAVVRDASGNVIASQNIGLKIEILETSASGSPVYVETHTQLSNNFGLINLNIGDGTVQSGNFSTIDWNSDNYFVKISIDITGGTNYLFMGTSQLHSVPYALLAKTAENSINDEVNDADYNPTNELQSISILGNDISLSNGGGTVTIPSSGSLWTESGSDMYYNGGNIAVGTTTPEANSIIYAYRSSNADGTAWTPSSVKTAINGYSLWGNNYSAGIAAFSDLDYANSTAFIAAKQDGTSAALLSYKDSNSKIWSGFFNGDINFTGDIYQNGTLFTGSGGSSLWTQSGSNVYYNSGNVGIGTSSPTHKLDIRERVRIDYLNANYDVWIQGGSDNNHSDTRNLAILGTSETAGDKLYINYADEYEGGTILGANVGIGTSSPNAKLDVIGQANISESLYTGMNIEVNALGTGDRYAYIDLIGDDTYTDYGLRLIRGITGLNSNSGITHRGTGMLYLQATEAGSIGLITSSVRRLTVSPDGNVGIGTTSPGVQLHLNGDGRIRLEQSPSVWDINAWGTGQFAIEQVATPSVTRFVINDVGNIGIGTSYPNAKLEVKGSTGDDDNTILFQVKDKNGDPVFTVFPDAVQVTVPDDGKAHKHGAFIVSGRAAKGKATTDITRLTKENYLIGHNVGVGITTGKKNSVYGYQAGQSLINRNFNTFLGYEAGRETNTDGNVAVGWLALSGNSSGEVNVAIGAKAGEQSTGHHNTFVGAEAGQVAGHYNVCLGYHAGELESGNNKLYIDNSGTSSPLIWGDFSTNQLKFNGDIADYSVTILNDGNNYNRHGLKIQAGDDDVVNTGSTSPTAYVGCRTGDNDNLGGIWRRNSDGHLYLYATSKSMKNKTITSLNASSLINKIRLYSDKLNTNNLSFNIDNLSMVYPEMIIHDDIDNVDMTAEGALIPILVKAIQEQSNEIEDLKKRLDKLENK